MVRRYAIKLFVLARLLEVFFSKGPLLPVQSDADVALSGAFCTWRTRDTAHISRNTSGLVG